MFARLTMVAVTVAVGAMTLPTLLRIEAVDVAVGASTLPTERTQVSTPSSRLSLNSKTLASPILRVATRLAQRWRSSGSTISSGSSLKLQYFCSSGAWPEK